MPKKLVNATSLSIKQLRSQAGRTQAEVAELFDISKRTYVAWEKNPDNIPHGTYLQLVWYLEQAAQIRKEIRKMATDHGRINDVILIGDDDEDDEYTVEHPPFEFTPTDPVTGRKATNEEMIRYETDGVEPFDGYADQLLEWERGWEVANKAQQEADGGSAQELKVVHPDPDYDEAGLPIEYDEPGVAEDLSTGKVLSKTASDEEGDVADLLDQEPKEE